MTILSKEERDEVVLAKLRAQPDEWLSADHIQRQMRKALYDPEAPSLMAVARSLARLAKTGRVQQRMGNGNWEYRSVT